MKAQKIKSSALKNKVGHFLSFSGLVGLSKLCKISYLVGSFSALFSGINVMAPLTGAFGTLGSTVAVFGFLTLIKVLFFGFNPLLLFVKYSTALLAVTLLKLHLPGFCASLGWRTNHWSVHVALPLACMAAFILHPVGGQAYAYSLYWLIPVVLYFINKKHIFLRALRSTFIAHAVGSVLWIYGVPMTSALWLGLIPVVFIERIVFAASMVVTYQVLSYLSTVNVSDLVSGKKNTSIFTL